MPCNRFFHFGHTKLGLGVNLSIQTAKRANDGVYKAHSATNYRTIRLTAPARRHRFNHEPPAASEPVGSFGELFRALNLRS
jgi:hypothetical protein